MRVVAMAAVMVCLPVSVLAQFGNPAGFAPDTIMEKPGVPAPNQTNNQDRLFAQLAASGGVAEVELGKLATGKASNDDVKHFADRMIDQHGKANASLKSIADKSKIPLPPQPDPDHAKMRADLEKLEGAQFDLAYMAAQIVEHQKAAQLFTWEIGSGQDAELQKFAALTLPAVLEHLDMARQIYAERRGEAAAQAGNP